MQIICGVDVSKDWLDGWIAPDHFARFANTPDGVAALGNFVGKHGVGLVVMEATGGIEQRAYLALWQAGQPCTIANPRSVRCFAEAMGYLEKTDRIDAEVIARFADARQMVATPPPSDEQQRLAALSTRMRQISSDITVHKQRLSSTRLPEARSSLMEGIAFLKQQAKTIAAAIAELIRSDPLWAALDQTFRSVKGVADRTVATLVAELPEIGTLPNKAVAKLVGLAPLASDSGNRQGNRAIRGGREQVRSILFLVADIARKYDPSLAEFRQRLLDSGKPKMVVRIALAHKLLVRLNAKARETRMALAQNA